MDSILNNVSINLGVPTWVLTLIIGLSITVFFTLSTYIWTANFTSSVVVGLLGSLGFGALLGYIPLWTVLIYGLLVIVFMVRYMYSGDTNITYESTYAENLKKAYEAKFGYRNSEFDKEIDQHILAVENLNKGFTRTIHMEKLKRLEKFVEVKK